MSASEAAADPLGFSVKAFQRKKTKGLLEESSLDKNPCQMKEKVCASDVLHIDNLPNQN
jgi:hypothetical protein